MTWYRCSEALGLVDLVFGRGPSQDRLVDAEREVPEGGARSVAVTSSIPSYSHYAERLGEGGILA